MIDFEIQWLFEELRRVNYDIQTVEKYYEMIRRGNTVSYRYDIIEEDPDKLAEHCRYLEKQLTTLKKVKLEILLDLKEESETYLEDMIV